MLTYLQLGHFIYLFYQTIKRQLSAYNMPAIIKLNIDK